MKFPLQALLIAPDLNAREAVHSHKKEITIREGHRDYRPGVAMLCCQIIPWAVMVDIIDVRHCTASEITEEEYKADGFSSQNDMILQMKRFYPDFCFNSETTVIRWKNARGFFVDHPDLYAYVHMEIREILDSDEEEKEKS